MFRITKESAWKFATSAGGSVGLGFFGAGTGDIMLTPPHGGIVTYHYASAGAGGSAGPKWMKMNASSSTVDSFSIGRIYLLDTFPGIELTPLDIEGVCMIAEVSVGAVLGGSATAMVLGIPPESAQGEVVKDAIAIGVVAGAGTTGELALSYTRLGPLLQSRAKALLLMAGLNSRVQLSVGALGSFGYVWMDRPPRDMPTPTLSLSDEEIVSTKSSTTAREIAIFMPSDVLFNFDESSIKRTAEPVLRKAGAIVKSHPRSKVVVIGHTDGVGTHAYNFGLSLLRARNVAQWLVKNGYENPANIIWLGLGKTKPVASNDDEQGRTKNRRVEIKIIAGG